MSEPKHTPGPWINDPNHPGDIETADGIQIATVWVDSITGKRFIALGPAPNPDQAKANVRLIAAAPDLLSALKGVIAVADRKTDEFDRARAAIAKATGK